MANELEVEAAEEEGIGSGDEAQAVSNGEHVQASQETNAGKVGADAGEEAEAAEAGDASGIAKAAQSATRVVKTNRLAADFAEAVDSAAAKAAATSVVSQALQGAAAATTAGGAAGASASAAEGAGSVAIGMETAEAAGAASAEIAEVAGAATVASGGAATPMVAIGVAGTAAIAEGPAAIQAAKEEWGAATAEITAKRDEVMSVEKQVEAASLETGAAVYEEGALMADRAAVESALAGIGSLIASQTFHLLALAVQAPVALVVAHQKLCGTALALCSCTNGLAVGGVAAGVGAAANALLAVSLGFLLGGPWARTVMTAAVFQADYLHLRRLPDLVTQMTPLVQKHRSGQDIGGENHEQVAQEVRRLWGWQEDFKDKLLNSETALLNATGKLKGVLDKGEAVAESAESQIEEAVEKSPAEPYVKQARQVAKQVTDNASRAVGSMTQAARKGTMKVAEKVLVPKANTDTTTVAPLTTAAPPEMHHFWSFLMPGVACFGKSVLYWVLHALTDLAIVSLAFVVFELALSTGRHLPRYRCGCAGNASLVGSLFHDVFTRWTQGMGILLAVWLISIILASKLRPYAVTVREYTDQSVGAWTFLTCGACCTLCTYYSRLLSKRGCCCAAKQVGALGRTPQMYSRLVNISDEEQAERPPQRPLQQDRSEKGQLALQRGLELQDLPRESSTPQCSEDDQSGWHLLELQSARPSTPKEDLVQQLKPQAKGGLSIEVQCIGTALASSIALILGLAEAPMTSRAVGSSLRSLRASWWLMDLLPWGLMASHIAPGWPHLLVSLPWVLVVGAVALSGLIGSFLTHAQRHTR